MTITEDIEAKEGSSNFEYAEYRELAEKCFEHGMPVEALKLLVAIALHKLGS